jgi:hypothetical protein
MNDLVKSASPADITQPSELPALINAAHEQVKQAFQRGAEHAIEAGRLLLQAKATVRHGNWLEWVGANCRFAERTAQLYMRLRRKACAGSKNATHCGFDCQRRDAEKS